MPLLGVFGDRDRNGFKNEIIFTEDEKKNAIRETIILGLDGEKFDKMLTFTMDQPIVKRELVIFPDINAGSYIGVPEKINLVLTVQLSDDWMWEFGEFAVSPKESDHHKYFHFEPLEGDRRSLQLHLKSTRLPMPGPEAGHPFDFKVLMHQPNGRSQLPIIIDPDVKNPPPLPPGRKPVPPGPLPIFSH